MEHISDAEKANIIKTRLAQFASDKYHNELNLEVGKASENEELIAQTTKNIELINTAIVVHEQILATLNTTEESEEEDASE